MLLTNFRWLRPLPFALVILLSTAPVKAEDQPPTSIGDFIDEVITPLAGQIADDGITHYKYKLTHLYTQAERQIVQKTSGELGGWFYRMFDFGLMPGAGAALEELGKDLQIKDARVREAVYKEMLAWLDTRRLPLKKELIELYSIATVEGEGTYTVCVEGKDRRYQYAGGRYHRLADSAIPCTPVEPKQPRSLKREEGSKPAGK